MLAIQYLPPFLAAPKKPLRTSTSHQPLVGKDLAIPHRLFAICSEFSGSDLGPELGELGVDMQPPSYSRRAVVVSLY